MWFVDTLVNLVSGLGTQRDKSIASTHGVTEMTPQELTNFFRSSWLSKKIVTIPAFDSYRRWRSWQAPKDQITKIEALEKKLQLRQRYREADMKARLYGASAIYIGTGEDAAREWSYEDVGLDGIKFLNVFNLQDLQAGELERDPMSPYFRKPTYFELRQSAPLTATPGVTTGTRIHPSRLIIFKGDEMPEDELIRNYRVNGWGGDSVLLARKDAILQAEATASNIASLIFEAKVDVFKIPNLMEQVLRSDYREKMIQRTQLAATAKGINGALLMDKEEEYEQKSATFGSLPDLMDRFFQQVSGAADIPMTRLFGQAPAGMNSTGESDLRNYYDAVSAHQDLDITPITMPLDEAVIRAALGSRPADIFYQWTSLWQVSDGERAEIGTKISNTIKTLVDTQLYPQEALAKAGANALVEASIMPGLDQEIDDAGGLPDYDLLAEEEKQREMDMVKAANNNAKGAQPRRAVNDAPPGPRTLYVRRDVVNARAIAAHYTKQGLTVQDGLHVTIIYSKKPVDWFETGEPWASKLTIPAGGPRTHAMFGPPGAEDSLVLMISSSELRWRHESFKAAGAESSYEKFHPHITLRYKDGSSVDNWEEIEVYQGEIELGPEIYEEVREDA